MEFDTWIATIAPYLQRYCCQVASNHFPAGLAQQVGEEASQEAMLRAARQNQQMAFDHFEGLRAWLWLVSHRCIMTAGRARRRAPQYLGGQDVQQEETRHSDLDLLQEALLLLSPEEREWIHLRFHEDLTYEQIAQWLRQRQPEAPKWQSVRRRLLAALERMRIFLEEADLPRESS
jgi:RNA polymerase sigma factor (sigma-70 family)